MIPLHELEKRFQRDPLPVRLGGIASDLGRLSGLAKTRRAGPDTLQGVLTELKLFTEWAGKEADLEVQRKLLSLQKDLATWDVGRTSKKFLPVMEKKAKKWSTSILKTSGLLRK